MPGRNLGLRVDGKIACFWMMMDCQMPVLDGYEATAQIRQWEVENGRPRLAIIALTAAAFEEDRQRCLAVGMDDVLTKPLAVAKLTAMLARRMTDGGGHAAVATSRAPGMVP